jgi:hypothetical protein
MSKAKEKEESKACLQYLVRGYMASRGPIHETCEKALQKGQLRCLGKTYPAGPVWFVPKESAEVPTDMKKQYHAERLMAISTDEILGELTQAAPEALPNLFNVLDSLPKEARDMNPKYRTVAERCGFWRLTECNDDYPAHIDRGTVIHAPKSSEQWKFPEHFNQTQKMEDVPPPANTTGSKTTGSKTAGSNTITKASELKDVKASVPSALPMEAQDPTGYLTSTHNSEVWLDCLKKADVVYVHQPCPDGNLAIFLMRAYVKADLNILPYTHDKTQIDCQALTGKRVAFVDLTPPALVHLATVAQHVLIVDHHHPNLERALASQEKEKDSEWSNSKTPPNVAIVFSPPPPNDVCGSFLVWQGLSTKKKNPLKNIFVEYAAQVTTLGDTGKQRLWTADQAAFIQVMYACKNAQSLVEVMMPLAKKSPAGEQKEEIFKQKENEQKEMVQQWINRGLVLQAEFKTLVETLIQTSTFESCVVDGLRCLFVKLSEDHKNRCTGEICRLLSEDGKTSFDLFMGYAEVENKYAVSCRSHAMSKDPKAGQFAQKRGGGGHAAASGFTMTAAQPFAQMLVISAKSAKK